MIKEKIRNFMFNTRTGKIIVKSIAFLNTLEGLIHLAVAAISIWGLIDKGVYDWRAWSASVENIIFGFFSLFTGYVLGESHKH